MYDQNNLGNTILIVVTIFVFLSFTLGYGTTSNGDDDFVVITS
ncbi:hypothetical protein [Alteribacter aurantiacus]|nr:hypothetical protein [Alteribacter aurantiacus]